LKQGRGVKIDYECLGVTVTKLARESREGGGLRTVAEVTLKRTRGETTGKGKLGSCEWKLLRQANMTRTKGRIEGP